MRPSGRALSFLRPILVIAAVGAACSADPAAALPPPPPPACMNQARGLDAADEAVVQVFCNEAATTVGAAMVVARDHAIAVRSAAGDRCAGKPGPVSVETPMRLGSITKLYTAMIAVRLEQHGELSLDAPISGGGPSLRALLSHRAGLPDIMPTAEAAATDPDALRTGWLGQTRPDAPWRYSNTGYYLAGMELAERAQTPYPTLVQRHLAEPAGLRATFVEPTAAVIEVAACGHLGRNPHDVADDFERFAHGARWTWPAGGVIASPQDLVSAALSWSSPTDVTALTDGAAPLPGDGAHRYGLGIHVWTIPDGPTLLHHAGNTGDFAADLFWIPAEGFAAALVSNTDRPMRATAAALLTPRVGATWTARILSRKGPTPGSPK